VPGAELQPRAGEELEIVLAPAGTLEVEIVDEAGTPVPEVRLAVTAEQRVGGGVAHFDALGEGDGFGPSAADGRVRIDGLPCGVALRVASRPSRAGPVATRAAATTIDLERRRGDVRLVVVSTGSLAGTVQPMPDGPVREVRVEARFAPRAATTALATAAVETDGRFVLERLPAGPGRLEIAVIRVGARASTEVGSEREAVVVPGELTDVGVLELASPARVAGHVADWNGSSGDYFVELRFLRDGQTLARTTIGNDGRFEAYLPPGRCALEVVHLGAVLGVVPCSAPDEDLELDLLDFCAGLAGRVPDFQRELELFFPHIREGDAADPSHRIAPAPIHGPMVLHDGAFRTLSLAPGRYSFLAPFGERGATWVPRIDLERGTVVDLGELECGFGTLRGRVVDERGQPVGGAEIVVTSPYASVLRTHAERRATSADDGAFLVDSLSAGPWRASARPTGSIGASDIVDVFPGRSASVEVAVERCAKLSVRVTRGGEPVASEALVLERSGGPERLEPRTSDVGGVELDALAPGEWSWSLGDEQRSGELTLRPGEARTLAIELRSHPVRVRLVRAGVLDGEVVGARAWSLDAERQSAARASSAHGADWFELDLEPGRYVVAAILSRAQGSPALVGLVDVAPDVRALDFAPAEVSVTVRIAQDARDASPPSLTALSVDGVAVAGWGIPLPWQAVEGGWRCDSVPPDASLLLGGAVPGRGRVEREIRTPSSGDTSVDWP